MSLGLLHILVIGFVLVLVLKSLPRSVGLMEYRSVALFPNWIRLETLSARTL
jgi:hypothetical protein